MTDKDKKVERLLKQGFSIEAISKKMEDDEFFESKGLKPKKASVYKEIVSKYGKGVIKQSVQGGLAFPSVKQPGAAVTIIDFRTLKDRDTPRYFLLGFVEHQNAGTLATLMKEMKGFRKVERWFGDSQDATLEFLKRQGKLSLAANRPPGLDKPEALNAYINILMDLLDQKRLIIPGAVFARLEKYGATVTVGNTTRVQDHPLIMSLGGVVAGMADSPSYSRAEQQREIEMANRELDNLYDDP